MSFLNQLPYQSLRLWSCTFENLDFLTEKLIYLNIEGALSSPMQKDLLSCMGNLKVLRLVLESPDDAIIPEITSVYPNLVKIETNLSLALAISKFPNLIEYIYEKKHETDVMRFDTSITTETHPRLRRFEPSRLCDYTFLSEEDRDLFQLIIRFPFLVSHDFTISELFLNDLSVPLCQVQELKIQVNEHFSSEHFNKIIEFFPSCRRLKLSSEHPWRIAPIVMNDGLKIRECSLQTLEFCNLYIEERSVDVLLDFFSSVSVDVLNLYHCVF